MGTVDEDRPSRLGDQLIARAVDRVVVEIRAVREALISVANLGLTEWTPPLVLCPTTIKWLRRQGFPVGEDLVVRWSADILHWGDIDSWATSFRRELERRMANVEDHADAQYAWICGRMQEAADAGLGKVWLPIWLSDSVVVRLTRNGVHVDRRRGGTCLRWAREYRIYAEADQS